jgi:hypothetical protein
MSIEYTKTLIFLILGAYDIVQVDNLELLQKHILLFGEKFKLKIYKQNQTSATKIVYQ